MIKRSSKHVDVNILEDIVAPDEASYPSALAKAVLGLSFRPKQKQEIDRLLERNNAGTITKNQKNRLEAYVRVGNFLSLLKAKARTSLAVRPSR
jgi:hypothetical protein